MRLVNWNTEQKDAFVRMQYNAQRQHYLTYYPQAEYSLILRDEQPIGRIIIERTAGEIRLMDIALLPEHRNGGIGTALVRDLVDEADRKQLPIELHVEGNNPAMRLYERFGFRREEEQGVYWRMVRPPSPQPKRSPA